MSLGVDKIGFVIRQRGAFLSLKGTEYGPMDILGMIRELEQARCAGNATNQEQTVVIGYLGYPAIPPHRAA